MSLQLQQPNTTWAIFIDRQHLSWTTSTSTPKPVNQQIPLEDNNWDNIFVSLAQMAPQMHEARLWISSSCIQYSSITIPRVAPKDQQRVLSQEMQPYQKSDSYSYPALQSQTNQTQTYTLYQVSRQRIESIVQAATRAGIEIQAIHPTASNTAHEQTFMKRSTIDMMPKHLRFRQQGFLKQALILLTSISLLASIGVAYTYIKARASLNTSQAAQLKVAAEALKKRQEELTSNNTKLNTLHKDAQRYISAKIQLKQWINLFDGFQKALRHIPGSWIHTLSTEENLLHLSGYIFILPNQKRNEETFQRQYTALLTELEGHSAIKTIQHAQLFTDETPLPSFECTLELAKS